MPEKKQNSSIKKFSLSKEFLSDSNKAGMLYGALVRSPYAFGKITNIGFSNLPEGYYLYTARDIPGENHIRTMGTDVRLFLNETVHYEGESVGILIGPDIKTVRKLASEIQLTFDISTLENVTKKLSSNYKRPLLNLPPLPQDSDSAIADFVDDLNVLPSLDELPKPNAKSSYTEPEQIGKALEKYEPPVQEHKILAKRTIRTGWFSKNHKSEKIDSYFESFDFHGENTYSFKDKDPEWIECSGALCCVEGPNLIVTSPTQWPEHLVKTLQTTLSVSPERIELKKNQVQHANANCTWRENILTVQAALAALISGNPVKLVLSHEEQKKFMASGVQTEIHIRSGLNAKGQIKAMEIKISVDAGYANPFSQELADRLSIAASSFYSIDNLFIETTVISSANPPTSISPKMIDAPAFFALENQINYLAEISGFLPDELRKLNMNKKEKTFRYSESKYEDAINAITEQSDFHRKTSSFRMNAERNYSQEEHIFNSLPERGIGMSIAYSGSYFWGTNFKNADPKIEAVLDMSGKLIINCNCASSSICDIWRKLASEMLQIEMQNVEIVQNPVLPAAASEEQTELPENLKTSISMTTELLIRALTDIQKKRFHSPLPIISRKAPTPAMKKVFSTETFSGQPFFSNSFGAAIAEVELNPDTYKTHLKGLYVSIDCGQIYSLKDAENTIRLTIGQELENLIQDVTIEPEILKIFFVQSKNPPSQIGTLIHNLIPAAFASSLSQASGEQIVKLPCSDETIFELFQKKAGNLMEKSKEHKTENEEAPDEQKKEQESHSIKSTEKEEN